MTKCNERTSEGTDERKDENYIPLGINAGCIIVKSDSAFSFGGKIHGCVDVHILKHIRSSIYNLLDNFSNLPFRYTKSPVKITMYLGLSNIIKFKFITNF